MNRTDAFNPFERTENCFYVALARLLGTDSTTLSLWTGKSELETEKIGLGVVDQQKVVETCRNYTRQQYRYINLQDMDNLRDYNLVNSPEPSMGKVLQLTQKHNLGGLCFAIEFYSDQEELGHFVNIQRRGPEEWDPETDCPVHPRYRPGNWELVDFQSTARGHGHVHGHLEDHWSNGTVRRIIGCARKPQGTVFGASVPGFAAGPPIAGSRRPEPTTQWDLLEKRWRFEALHHGHWGSGWCLEGDQSEEMQPQWRYVDIKRYTLVEWEYSFDGSTWVQPKFTKCNMLGSKDGPCIVYSDP